MNSQNILKQEPRVTTTINSKGDTLVQFKLKDAKLLLSDVLQKKICDSLVFEYELLDKKRVTSYNFLDDKLKATEAKLKNSELAEMSLNTVIKNKDTEVAKLNKTIISQDREIFKQKTLKIFGFSMAVILPITTLLLLSK
jgi:hypothetical protein